MDIPANWPGGSHGRGSPARLPIPGPGLIKSHCCKACGVDAPYEDGHDAGKRVKLAIDRMATQLDGRKLDMGQHGVSIAEDTDTIKLAQASIVGFS
ncbi:hypothetical protein [Rhizobium herbae]|uniref:Uncharacterized protein n=1 Tax=Rhizobium herbae TaxID=508661 RepID=A0ABS4EVQ3_9HYPH|nr:hypothetical protein [Rhizobium herbae]MBP1862007.1 hypothetical protein [Rhizobium herbae]